MPSRPWRVFLSHTSDLRPYVEAAKAAVLRARHAVIDMEFFTAEDSPPSSVCRDAVLDSDVYVLIAGACYGSPVRDNPAESYTELEFRVAGEKGIPRLAFAVVDSGSVEPRQQAFRDRVADSVTVAPPTADPARLEMLVYQALIKLARPGPVWSVPPLNGSEVARPALTAALIEAVLAPDAGPVGVTTGLVGAGGFGKTTLARMVTHDPAVRAAFPDGAAWVTVGEDAGGPELAASITSVARLFDASAPEVTDPLAAGAILDRALAGRKALLVVDDVWTAEQVEPFRLGAGVRLFTTRQRDLLRSATAAVEVDQMTPDEARRMIGAGVPGALVEEVLAATGRWPVLLALVGGAVRDGIAHGGDPATEMTAVLDALRVDGITVLDVGDAGSRASAVSRTIDASLRRLAEDERARYFELAVFGEDVIIPGEVIDRLWAYTGKWSSFRSRRFCGRLFAQGLLAGYRRDPDQAQLHDVVRAYLRHRTSDRRADLDRAIVDAHRALAPAGWASLPAGQGYLWSWLPAHLRGAGLHEELDDLLDDPHWLVGKLERIGPAGLEADLLLGARAKLAAVVGQNAHLLGSLDPPGSLAATLASRIPPSLGLADQRDDILGTIDGPCLRPLLPLPDLADTALIRVIPQNDYLIAMLAAPDSSWLAAVGSEIRLIDPAAGTVRHTLPESDSPTGALAVAPDGSWFAAGDWTGSVRLWDPRTAAPLHVFPADQDRVDQFAVAPDGSWLAATSRDGTVRLWDPRSGEHLRTLGLPAAAGARSTALVPAPDGRWLAHTTRVGSRVWDPATGRMLHRLPNSVISVVAVDPAGRWLATYHSRGRIMIWSTSTWTPVARLGERNRSRAAVAPDGRWLAVAHRDTVAVWKTEIWAELRLLGDTGSEVRVLTATPGGQLAAATEEDDEVILWSAGRWERPAFLAGHTEQVHTIVAAPNGTWLATAADDGTIRLWNPAAARAQSGGPEPTVRLSAVSATPGGRVATGTDTSEVHLWNLADGTRSLLAGSEADQLQEIRDIAIAPDGSWIAAAQSETVLVWDRASGEILRRLPAHAAFLVAGPDSSWLAVGGAGLQVWNPRNGHLLETHFGPVTAHAAAADGRILAVAERTGPVSLWAGPGTEPVILHDLGPHAPEPAMAMAPDGSWLVISDGSGDVQIWDCRRRSLRRTIDLGTTFPDSFAVTASGLICTVGHDQTIRLWDPSTGCARTALRVEDELHRVVTSQDRIIVNSARRTYFLQLTEAGTVDGAGML
ncbi:DUF4062 domain-containing protein [Paractinoplanes toevensis]|uniref:DUF4062 domain-containing protein n=1 Tax=Paractinoplanes toevensis TaxID=571911 RepID=A0A919TFR8_9ACTN|nr:DUF4062 domain-containing protein [Actinoplanes toevensis]GIM93284.1 hypothetical protein Ato02nite_050770 [Actinoplanes toevensis]